MTTAVVPLPTAPVPTSAPATPTSSLPSAVASQARLERDDLRWELRDREMMPDKIGELAAMVERVIEQASPPAGVEAVLLGIEGLAARFGLAIPDPDALEADVVELAAWPVDEWEAALDGIRCTFRSGYSRFPTIADFRAAVGRNADRLRRIGDLRRLVH
ncbi:hypothetical protein [Roseomonas genomospecies 6]|uniref:Uncharacterized protein n=1 Tax=Roseomonas genomospecies 6 TaxID=214106 RepID=A0A9W7NFQ5_9PROT|nr:hypothetical protein [Roseomonas genomospecies 6]KAA0675656.1 hypothetical protein DS843_30590 [Roseomonas genomospecies 6]